MSKGAGKITGQDFICPSGARLRGSTVGFGGAAIGNQFRALSEAEVTATLEAAWNAGMRWFDTAPHYGLGLSETRLGAFLKGRPRADYTLSTKVGRILADCAPDEVTAAEFVDTPQKKRIWDFTHDGILRSLEASLQRLGLDRVDVLLVHDLDPVSIGDAGAAEKHLGDFLAGGLRAIRRLREDGTVRAIGAGLNWTGVAEDFARRFDFDILLLAGRYTLLEQGPLDSFFPLCRERGIGVLLGGVYNSGILATGARPGAMHNYAAAAPDVLARVAAMERICAGFGVPLATAALRFALAHPLMVSVIPGAKNPQEIAMTEQSLAQVIPGALWQALRDQGLIRPDAPVPA
jgi:D-threo-aldose 1-dehydrogenase